jgi:hypothetical protein
MHRIEATIAKGRATASPATPFHTPSRTSTQPIALAASLISKTKMPKKYTRQGIEAAVRLSQCKDDSIWLSIESKYSDMIAEKGGNELVELDQFCEDLAATMKAEQQITKDELLKIVQWKFLIGKPRYALMNHLKANTAAQVKENTKAGFASTNEGDAKQAISEVAKLRGVGPATASAILSIYKPEMFAFMADEVIECLYEGKRGYTASIYHNVNDKCSELAESLGTQWNTRRVGRALWSASRVSAGGGVDLTATVKGKQNIGKEATSKPPAKRRKTTRSTK